MIPLKIIKEETNKIFNTDIDIKSRKREIVLPRQVFCYVSRSLTYKGGFYYPFEEIGDCVGLNHATVIHSCNIVNHDIKYNKELREKVNMLTIIINDLNESLYKNNREEKVLIENINVIYDKI